MNRFWPAALLCLVLAVPAPAQQPPTDARPPLTTSVANYRQAWRDIITELVSYAKGRNKNFVILMRDGAELIVKGQREVDWDAVRDPTGINFDKRLPLGSPYRMFIKVVDGVVFDNLYCGEAGFDKPLDEMARDQLVEDDAIARELRAGVERPRPAVEEGPYASDTKTELAREADVRHRADIQDHKRRVLRAIAALRTFDRPILSIEDCPNAAAAGVAHKSADRDRVTTFAEVGDRKLDTIPKTRPLHENAEPVGNIAEARTFLPDFNGDRYGSREEWLRNLGRTNYDVLIIDVAWRGQYLTKTDIARLKLKNLGAPRLVMADMPMGRAYDSRWYWQKGWEAGNPPFLFAADSAGPPGTFLTDPMDPQWREILGKYLAGLIDLGFDGVILDDLDTYLWFEDIMPLER